MGGFIQVIVALLILVAPEKPVWVDDFNQGTIDTSKWTIVTGDGCPELCGFGNNELQYYTNKSKNLRVEDGKLIIEVHQESMGSMNYTSAKLITKGKGDWKYGRVEVRAKLPTGKGTWPAIWMLPTIFDRNMDWPLDGEIDIMEHVGYDQNTIHGTVHTAAYNGMLENQKSGNIVIDDSADAFHNYIVIWTENKIEWYVDDEKYFEYTKENDSKEVWPFDEPYHLILNIAVGGNWGGSQGIDDTIWPQRMEIEYVKVYER